MSLRSDQKVLVMLVDDDHTTLVITQAVLENAGYRVSVRQSAIGTSAAILRERPQVVLMDIEMPGLSGDRLVALLRGRSVARDVHFIFYSGAHSHELDAFVEKTGALGGIAKTGDQAQFLKEFERVLQTAR